MYSANVTINKNYFILHFINSKQCFICSDHQSMMMMIMHKLDCVFELARKPMNCSLVLYLCFTVLII